MRRAHIVALLLAVGCSAPYELRRSASSFQNHSSIGVAGATTAETTSGTVDGAGMVALRTTGYSEKAEGGVAHWDVDVEFWDIAGEGGASGATLSDWRLTFGGGRDWLGGTRLADWRYTWGMGLAYNQATFPVDAAFVGKQRWDSFGVCAELEPEVRLAATADLTITGFAGVTGVAAFSDIGDGYEFSDLTAIYAQGGLRVYSENWLGELAYMRRSLSYAAAESLAGFSSVPEQEVTFDGIALTFGFFW